MSWFSDAWDEVKSWFTGKKPEDLVAAAYAGAIPQGAPVAPRAFTQPAPLPLQRQAAPQQITPEQLAQAQALAQQHSQSVPSFEEYKQELIAELDMTETMLQQLHTKEVAASLYAITQKADLDKNGIIEGDAETKALLKSFLTADNEMSAMLGGVVQMLCAFAPHAQNDAELQAIMDELPHAMENLTHGSGPYIAAEKNFAKAVIAEREGTGSPQATQTAAAELVEESLRMAQSELEQHPRLQEIEASPYTDEQKAELKELVQHRTLHMATASAKTQMELIANDPDIRKAAAEQPEVGQLGKISWAELCEASKAEAQHCVNCR